jgi:hypothetical protein
MKTLHIAIPLLKVTLVSFNSLSSKSAELLISLDATSVALLLQ